MDIASSFRTRTVTWTIAAALAIAIASGAISARAQGVSARDVAALRDAKLIYIATVRKDGNQSTAVPVWFVTSADNRVLIQTAPQSWKAKRIRRGSPAIVWIGAATGPAFIGDAKITTEASVLSQIETGMPQKYLLARVGFSRPTKEKFDSGKICAIEITPIRDLPDNFKSAPGTPAPTLH